MFNIFIDSKKSRCLILAYWQVRRDRMLPQSGTKRNVSSPHLPVTLRICQGDSHSPFLTLVTVKLTLAWWGWCGHRADKSKAAAVS